LARVDADVGLRNELITLFLTDSPRLVTELRRSVEQRRASGDLSSVDRAHAELQEELATLLAQFNAAVAEAVQAPAG
jgi:hypothetical protein